MARQVTELNITNFQETGATTAIARYTFNLEIKYIDNQGVARVHGPQQYTYPNALAPMPLNVRRAFAEKMIEAVARVALGIAEWRDYE